MTNALKEKTQPCTHAIRRKALENTTTKLDQKIEEIERLHDGAKMFKYVRLLYRTPYRQPKIHEVGVSSQNVVSRTFPHFSQSMLTPMDQGRSIQDQEEYGKHVSDFFTEQFQGDVKPGISAFTGEPRPLKDPITESKVLHATNRLNNNRASGSDELPGDC